MELIQVVVELALEVGRGFHLLLYPDMAGGHQQLGLLLRLDGFLRLVGGQFNGSHTSRVDTGHRLQRYTQQY